MNIVTGAAGLTEEELQVLQLLARGERTSEIAKHLRLEYRNVADISKQLKSRFAAETVEALVEFARQAGLVSG